MTKSSHSHHQYHHQNRKNEIFKTNSYTSFFWKLFNGTNDALIKLKMVDEDSATETEVFDTSSTAAAATDVVVELNEKSNGGVNKAEKQAVNSGQLESIGEACKKGNLARVKFLIESGQVDPNKSDAQSVYPLHWAAIANRLEVAKYLIEKGSLICFSIKK